MPADVITVNFAALRAAADSLSVKAKALEANADNLQQSLKPMKETWVASGSSAGEAAEQSETRLRAAIADIIAVIAQFSAKTTEAHDTQMALENKNTSFFA
ncbi:MAG: WXG100 family type VII secretion target [Actinoplanes sp.]